MNFRKNSKETADQVFHSNAWQLIVNIEDIEELISLAEINNDGKARLCLHPHSSEQMQVTYLAFSSKYTEKIHKHPHRPEVLIPVIGKAERRTYDHMGNVLTLHTMEGGMGSSFSTEKNLWHSLTLVSNVFVMIEIGTGPFLPDSTVNFSS